MQPSKTHKSKSPPYTILKKTLLLNFHSLTDTWCSNKKFSLSSADVTRREICLGLQRRISDMDPGPTPTSRRIPYLHYIHVHHYC